MMLNYAFTNNTAVFYNIDDYDLDATFNCGQCFRWDRYKDGYRGFIYKYLCYIYSENGNICAQCIDGFDNKEQFISTVTEYLALDIDYTALKTRFSCDSIMKQAIDFAPGIRVLNQPFEQTLITFIISQNNNIPRIKKIVDALSQAYGTKIGDAYAFPSIEQLKDVSIDDLFALKMGFRAKYVYDAVQKMYSGEISKVEIDNMTKEQAQKYLMQIKGVGPKVADCVLLFSCKKYDCFPKDVWINRAMQQLFSDGLPQCVMGYEGIAQQYIFHYARFNLEKGI